MGHRNAREGKMEFITVDAGNIDAEHICCAIGSDRENRERAETKKAWMRGRFEEGLIFRRLDERGKVFIEYMPVESVWKPVLGEGWLVIDCLWVSGKFKGRGLAAALLASCVEDARKRGAAGVAVVTGERDMPFLTDPAFYLGAGFEVLDRAPPHFQLLGLKIGGRAKRGTAPRFADAARTGRGGEGSGISIVYSNQCPFMEEYAGRLAKVAAGLGMTARARRLESGAEAREASSPFGTLGIYHDGRFLSHELMTEDRFRKLIASEIAAR
jgi:GNAT superfamily N-acetyltransferase